MERDGETQREKRASRSLQRAAIATRKRQQAPGRVVYQKRASSRLAPSHPLILPQLFAPACLLEHHPSEASAAAQCLEPLLPTY